MATLKSISVTEGWEPDITKRYYIEHSRHDNYVPIQSVRGIIPRMTEKGFKPTIVPGKSNLQTATLVFKLKHQQSGIVWAIQTLAAIQFWPRNIRITHRICETAKHLSEKAFKCVCALVGIDLFAYLCTVKS